MGPFISFDGILYVSNDQAIEFHSALGWLELIYMCLEQIKKDYGGAKFMYSTRPTASRILVLNN